MNLRFNPILALAFTALATTAFAQTGGSMSGPANHMATHSQQGCTPMENHMTGTSGDHMAGGHMSSDHMSGDHMSGNGMMAAGDHMSANHAMNANCQTDQTPAPKH